MVSMELTLKTRTKDHVATYWEKTQDEEIRKWLPSGIDSLEQAFILYEESLKEGALSYGKVIYYEGGYIGDVWCYGIDVTNERMCMLSFAIFEKKLWRRGIAAEAAKMFIKEVFDKFDIDKIGAFTYSDNCRSVGLLKKLGFEEIDRFVEEGIESVYFEKQAEKGEGAWV